MLNLLDLFLEFTDVLAPGSQGPRFTLDSLGTDMGFLREFITFAVILFASLGMSVQDLESLASKASHLHSSVPYHNKHIVTFVLLQDLRDTFDAFGLSVTSWLSTPTLAQLAPLVASTLHTDAARARVRHDRESDLSAFGLPSTGLFALAVPPASSSSLPPTPLNQHAGVKRKQHPGPSAGSALSAGGGGAARVRPNVGMVSQVCAVGEVVHWGKHYVNWSALVAAFTAENRNITLDENFKKVLLSAQSTDKAFDGFAPSNASAPARVALRTWYNGNKWKAFEISKPPDFR